MKCKAEIEAAAVRWLLSQERTPAPADDLEFKAWLAADARHRSAYLLLERTWRTADGLKAWRTPGPVDPRVLIPAKARYDFFSPRSFAIAASAVLVVAALLGIPTVLKSHGTSYETDIGGYQRVVLQDGSTVQLNTDSKLRVKFTAQRREVNVVRGEVFFEVVRDPKRPFTVNAAASVVQVLGTAFSVHLRDRDAVEVLVTDGRVSFRPAPAQAGAAVVEPTNLQAGEVAVTGPAGIAVRATAVTDVKKRLAWQEGELDFKGDALTDVVEEFNRYNHRHLEVTDPRIAHLQIGGNFRATDVDGFLRAMHSLFGIVVDESESMVRISGPSSSSGVESEITENRFKNQ